MATTFRMTIPSNLATERELLRQRVHHEEDSDDGADDETITFTEESVTLDEEPDMWSSATQPRSPSPLTISSPVEQRNEERAQSVSSNDSLSASPKPKILRRDNKNSKRAPDRVVEHDFTVTWDESKEDIVITETPDWFDCADRTPLSLEQMSMGMKSSSRYTTHTEATTSTEYCQSDMHALMQTRKAKLWDDHTVKTMREARSRANPFESIAGAGFQNRAAMKMANIDAVFGRCVSNPTCIDTTGKLTTVPSLDDVANTKCASLIRSARRILYFADICAGPGGFSEYMLWRRSYSSRGFGFTLRGKDDFKLEHFSMCHAELFAAHYGEAGDGDITKSANIKSFAEHVVAHSEGLGVHSCMADGGFSVVGHEHLQEVLSKHIALCQLLTAVSVLRQGGTFVCKLFDTFTAFSVGCIFLMTRAFERISIHKPNTSRPANAERYLVCTGYRHAMGSTARTELIAYMHAVNDQMCSLRAEWETDPHSPDVGEGDRDVQHIVSPDIIRQDDGFVTYMTATNNRLAHRQFVYLCKYDAYARNPTLHCSLGQSTLRAQCLDYWLIPQSTRAPNSRMSPKMVVSQLIDSSSVPETWLTLAPTWKSMDELTMMAPNNCIALNFRYWPVSTGRQVIVIGMGKGRSFTSDDGENWEHLPGCYLPARTLCLAELTYVVTIKDAMCVNKHQCLRIVDAHTLGGQCVANLPIDVRVSSIERLLLALGTHNTHTSPVRLMSASVRRMSLLVKDIADGRFKLNVESARVMFKLSETEHVPLNGIAMVRATRANWVSAWSVKSSLPYVFHLIDGRTVHDTRAGSAEAFVNLEETLLTRAMWSWKGMRNLESLFSTCTESDIINFEIVAQELVDSKQKANMPTK